MCKAGVIGHFGLGSNFISGQTIKTKIFTDELKRQLGSDEIKLIDTYKWKFRFFVLFIKCFYMMLKCKNIIILPGPRGVKALVPLLNFFNIFFHRNLHYVVIGGWLPKYLEQKQKFIPKLRKYTGIYVETCGMIKMLNSLGLKNVLYLPNFKTLDIVHHKELSHYSKPPYKLCTFSRVTKEKGIEVAIEAVNIINSEKDDIIYTLDIYGPIDEKYNHEFDTIIKSSPSNISYKGCIDYDKTTEVLKHYFVLLFPTFYPGEGFPGTIIDAFASGLPVIANDWRYNNELVENNRNGFLYNSGVDGLVEILRDILHDVEKINQMKKNCLIDAEKYKAENVIKSFIDNLR